MEYLIVVDYHSDAERKRIDATIDRWRSKKDISKEKGVEKLAAWIWDNINVIKNTDKKKL